MAQLRKGTTYTATGDSSFVTHTNLNAHVDNAKLIGGAIGEQVANPVTTDADELLIKKGDDLFKQTKAEFTNTINSNTINVNTLSVENSEFDEISAVNISVDEDIAVAGNVAINGNIAITGEVTGDLFVNGIISTNGKPTEPEHLVTKGYADGVSNALKEEKGYVRFPSGIVFQWGKSTAISPLQTQTQSFAEPFETACLNVQATKITTQDYFGNKKDTHAVFEFTLTGFKLFNQHETSTATYNWFAIGY